MVLLSITPLLGGVLRLDIIAPFHTSGPPLLQFHLDIEQWGYLVTNSSHVYITFPVAISKTFAVISGTDHSGSPNAANTFYSVSNVGMYIGSAIAVGKSWIVLGVS